jgi:phage gp36-like protein
MGYITTTDFEEAIGTLETVQLTNLDDPSADTVNTVKLTKIIDEASGEINSFLATRYTIPLVTVPSYIKAICIDICEYRLARNPNTELADRYKNAIARLKDLEKGQMLLIDELTGVAVPQRNPLNTLVDERGQRLDTWSLSVDPVIGVAFTREILELF